MLSPEHEGKVEGAPDESSTKDKAKPTLAELAVRGVGASYLLTQILTQGFGIKPTFALGYSMGEAAMWASLQVWQKPDALIAPTLNDALFTQEISGNLDCVRREWQLNECEPIVWNSFVVRTTPSKIMPYLTQYPRVYIPIVQGDSLIIAGCEQSCRALLKEAKLKGIATHLVTAMHTAPAMQMMSQVKDFYLQPLQTKLPENIQFLVTNQDRPITLANNLSNRQTPTGQMQQIANSIANTFCRPLDFNQLINKAVNQGANLFLEVGADRQTTTIIDKIIKQQQLSAQAFATNSKGADEVTALLKSLAKCVSHQVPVKLDLFIESLTHAINELTAQPLLQGDPN